MGPGALKAMGRVLAAALLAASCGTRVSGSAALEGATARSATSGAVSHPVADVTSTGDSAASTAGGPSASGTGAAARAEGTGPNAATGSVKDGPVPAQKGSKPTTGPAAPGPVDGVAGGNTPRSPVVVASVGTSSGPAGYALGAFAKGAQLWVRSANTRGGVNGHPIRFIVFDDRGDPALHRSQVQEAIERHGAIAFLANGDSLAGNQNTVDYVTAKRVPNVGVDGGGRWYYTTPMWFPQMVAGDPYFYLIVASVADVLVPAGRTKVATLTCLETPTCDELNKIWARHAPPLGLSVVYQARASLTQPDFTAECLSARNGGAEIIFVALDAGSIGRLAASCDRQGYRPVFTTASGIATDAMKDNPLFDGLVTSSPVFPYVQKGTPAVDEFQQDLKRYGSGLTVGIGIAAGWTAGKLIEKAGAKLAEPPTSASLLEGLWSIKDDTLGGLTEPLTFVKDQPASPKRACYFPMVIRQRSWVSPDGYKMHCHDIPDDLAR